MTRAHRDDGIAAVEFAIVLSLLLFLAFGALPLYAMLRGYQQVSKASAATLRYATSVSPNGTRNTSTGALSRRPSYDDIQSFARTAASDPDLAVVVTVCRGATCTDIDKDSPSHASPIPARAGDTVTLTVRKTVDLSVLGRLANGVSRISGNGPRFPENDVTMTSTASAREE